MIQLRPNQEAAIGAVFDYWAAGGGNPLVEMATGTGKSVVIAKLAEQLLAQYDDMNIIVLVHVRELVEQNAMALLRAWPSAPLGIYSAGLGRRDTHRRILFGSIQSVFRHDGYSLGHRDLVLIDEAHLVPKAGEGMYQTFLTALRHSRPDLRVAGFTATPYRLDSGRLDDGEGRIFDRIVYSYGIRQGIEDGYLSPLMSKATATKIDVAGVAKRGGEFIPEALARAVDIDELTRSAVLELAKFGEDRRSWVVFCTGVEHAHHVRDAIQALGFSCAAITGQTPSQERKRAISDFKAGRIRCLTNANVLTTGFDAPGVDMIAFLRPTLSTGLYVQMCGRGTRLADGKDNCLVLDFAGNVRRHGPVDMIDVRPSRKGEKAGTVKEDRVAAKECPNCSSLQPLGTFICGDCGYEWERRQAAKHEAEADADTPILSSEAMRMQPADHPVMSWSCARHTKFGAPDSLKVTYMAGLMAFNEWVALEHTGFARTKAERWWRTHGGGEPPATIAEAIGRFKELRRPVSIQARKAGKWWEIVGRRFDQPVERAA